MDSKKEFKKMVILDNLLLFPEHKKLLSDLADEVIYYTSSTPETIKEVVRNQDRGSRAGLIGDKDNPQCATELGIEELAEEELARRVKGADCILTCWTGIPPSILKDNPQLRYIGFWTHDKNKVGVPEAEAQGVKVTYVPDYGTVAVAELAFAGILNLARDVKRHEKNTLTGRWPYEQFKKGRKNMYVSVDHEPTPEVIKEFTLEGKSLGIIGMGRIGEKVAHIGKYGFSMNVSYTSKTRKEGLEKSHEYMFKDLKEVMGSDIVSIHLSPDAPRHFVNKEMLSTLRDGAILVNTSVGHVVDQEALMSELKSGRISAYLDVYDGLPPRKELKEIQANTVSTYRAGWYTKDSVTRKGNSFIKHLMDYIQMNRG